MSQGIFGLHPWAVFLGFVILLMGFYIYSQITTRQRLQRKVSGKIWVDFYNQSNGACQSYLCSIVNESEIKPPDKLAKEYNLDKSKLQGIQIPENIGSGVYYTMKEAMYTTWYPPGKRIQVKVDKIAYVVGIPIPIVSINCDLWDTTMLKEMGSSMIEKSRDDMTLAVLNAQDATWWDNLDKWTQYIKKIPTLQWVGIGAIGAAGLSAYFAYQAVDLLKAWSGG